jgi:hypothetical protein
MAASSSEHSGEVVATYQSMVPSPSSSSRPLAQTIELDTTPASDSTSVEIERGTDDEAPRTALERMLRDYRVLEFGCAVVIYLLALVFSIIAVNERPIPGIRVRLNATTAAWALDPSLDQEKLSEHGTPGLSPADGRYVQLTSCVACFWPVPMWALTTFGLGLPLVTNLAANYLLPRFCPVRVIAHDTRDFLLSFLQSMALAEFFTQFTKNITGRFRPCFYHMCKWNYDVVWDGVTNLCTDAAGEKEGRRSFPSGHASFA